MDWFVGHMIGDYLLQTDWQAANKKARTWPCLVHVVLYTLSVWACTGWPWWAAAITFVCHFIQDRTQIIRWYMSIGQKGFSQPPFTPWSSIVVDNTFHFVQLWLTAMAVMKWG